jgi:prolyl-tRNA synthetase
MVFLKRDLPKKSDNLSEWYNKVVLLAGLADYGPAKGTMIFRPYGYAIWELVQKEMDKLIKAKGVENAYFPLFIPESLLRKEQKHVEGFSPELAVVTIGGGEELKEKLIVRPTSETIMYEAYARWIQSWRDLPMMINQWNNVVRWEKRTYLFLRTTEFLWQEGHTAHAEHGEAWEMVLWAAKDLYAEIYEKFFGIPGYLGRKSEAEKFAGADVTVSYESLMPEGKVLQNATAHDLGQNFSRTFDIKFQTKAGGSEYAWQTSWGLSTRSIGGLIMLHGDDAGLRLPPRLAPIQVIILPVRAEKEILVFAQKVAAMLSKKGIRAKVDDSDKETLGSKINTWELKGIPLRLEVGPKEIEKDSVTAVRRDTSEKSVLSFDKAEQRIPEILEEIQSGLYLQAETFLKENTREANSYEEFKDIIATKRGFVSAFWCEDPKCEQKIKEETKATARCLPLDAIEQRGKCVYCQKPAKHRWLFGQAY